MERWNYIAASYLKDGLACYCCIPFFIAVKGMPRPEVHQLPSFGALIVEKACLVIFLIYFLFFNLSLNDVILALF